MPGCATPPEPIWKLIIEDDEGKRTTVPLTRDDYTIGRKEGNTIRLTERNVSREHARIRRANGPASAYLLEDHSSYNGVYVNGLRVATAQELASGDLIQIGDYRIVLQDDASSVQAPEAAATTDHMKSTIPTGSFNRGSQLLERPNRLVMLAGPTPGAEYPLTTERITIGRAEDATISVNHNSVSRLHCEIHSLGEGRFEIVDKGSSNGVRVNGSDLRRGIIEAGDVLELGDVRLRFVGAGQIFLPGVGDSQQFESLEDRGPASVPAAKIERPASIVPWVLLGAVVAGAVVIGGWVFLHNGKPEPIGSAPSPSSLNPEQTALDAAKVLCDQGKCDVAHDKLLLSIPDSSPLRSSSTYQTIQTRWADSVLATADKETDPTRKRAALNLVADDSTVPDSRRKIASAKLNELDAAQNTPSATTSVAPPVSARPTNTGVIPVNTSTSVPTNTATATTSTATSTAPSATTTHRPPTGGSVFAQASQMALNGDTSGARTLLEPRVMGGKATPDEVNLLKGICKGQGDKVCTGAIKKLYP